MKTTMAAGMAGQAESGEHGDAPRLLDALVVGSGPAGIAAAGAFQDAGLSCLMVDKGALADAVAKWPVYMRFFSTAVNVELPGFPLITVGEKPTREEYLTYLRRYVSDKKLRVKTHWHVESIEREGDGGAASDGPFVVRGRDQWGEAFQVKARNVVIATGAYEKPKMLGCPGEELPKVSHYFTEVHPYAMTKVVVVGGRNSAAETALLLWRAGAEVTLVHRGAELQPLKFWLHPDLENRIRRGEIKAFFSSQLVEVRPREVVIARMDAGERVTIENDYVLAMTGYRPDTALLERAGVSIDAATKRPTFDPTTLETNVPGLYVAGVICAGDISNEIFIENSRHHGDLILNGIHARMAR